MIATREEFHKHRSKKTQGNGVKPEYARVIAVDGNGEPVLLFPREQTASKKKYICMKHYIPEIGDRVMLIGNVIMGGWRPRAKQNI